MGVGTAVNLGGGVGGGRRGGGGQRLSVGGLVRYGWDWVVHPLSRPLS